jgi:hypothetical protein
VKLLAVATLLFAQIASFAETRKIEVIVELAKGEEWHTVDARTVFEGDQQIRFRFRSSAAGYVYVLDETSSGEFVWLFPDAESGLNNQVQTGKWSLIPATQGAFGIPKRAGYEKIYWIVSPAPLKDIKGEALRGSQPNTMTPRCEEPSLKARGACLDKNGGPKALSETARLDDISGATLRSRNLSFDRSPQTNIVKAKAGPEEALIYEFWIAHR